MLGATSIYDVPAPPISNEGLFLLTFVHLFTTSALPPDYLAAAVRTRTNSTTPQSDPSRHPHVLTEPSKELLLKYHNASPALPPDLPLPPLPSASRANINSEGNLIGHKHDRSSVPFDIDKLDVAAALAQLDSAALELEYDLQESYIMAPPPSVSQHTSWLKPHNIHTQPVLKKFQFRSVNFNDHGKLSTPLSLADGGSSPAHLSPDRRSSGNISEISDASFEIEDLLTDLRLSASIIETKRPSLPYLSSSTTASPFMYSSRQREGLSVSSEATTTTSSSSLSPNSQSPDPFASLSSPTHPSKTSKRSKSKHLFSSSSSARKTSAQSEILVPVNTPDTAASRSSSESQLPSPTYVNSTKVNAPYGSELNSPYYVLTNVGVRLVTPGQEGDAPVDAATAVAAVSAAGGSLSQNDSKLGGRVKKNSASSATSSRKSKKGSVSSTSTGGSSAWLFGKKHRSSQTS
ncbi:uncharacterized protein V2V93DRAFT_365371 [Kockiozyma suomiensis]|uniref:uncharacterized protein n=1 Tax=Kockiozyma suomiensis TaxID=1337062 RepID=UPI003343423A